jgi:hypothetical protein
MVRTKNFEAAATCFRKAGNVSRAQACQAQAKLQAAAQVGVRQREPHSVGGCICMAAPAAALWLRLPLYLAAPKKVVH